MANSISRYLDNKTEKPTHTIRIKNGDRVLYSVPQHLDIYNESLEGSVIYFRVNGRYENLLITLKCDGEEIYFREKGKMSWLETGKIVITEELARKIRRAKEIVICASEKKNGNDTDDNSKDNE